MNQNQYEYIRTVAEQRSLTRAAEKLFITPSALCKSIQKLEEELNTKLFYRDKKSYRLTYAGQRYLDWSNQILALEKQMHEEISDIVAKKRGILRLGVQLGNIPYAWKIICSFHEAYPQILIQLTEDGSAVLTKKLKNQELDFVISEYHGDTPEFTADTLSDSQFVLVAPKAHPIRTRSQSLEGCPYPAIHLEDILDEPMILPFIGQSLRDQAEAIVQKLQLSLNVMIEASTISTILHFVSSGYGLTFSYDSTVRNYLATMDLTLYSLAELDLTAYRISLLSLKNYYLSETAQTFRQICLEKSMDS